MQFLIAADIIKTISAPTFEHMLQLGFVVGIRTVIAIALNREGRYQKKGTRWKEEGRIGKRSRKKNNKKKKNESDEIRKR